MRENMLNIVLWLLLLSITVGCATTKYSVSPGQERNAFQGKVLVYENNIPTGVDFELIGDFVEQKPWYGSTKETKRESLQMAASKGANGILIERHGHRVSAWSWSSPYTAGKLLWIKNYDIVTSGQSGVEMRMRQIVDLHRKGLITDSEYEAKRKAILNPL